MTFNRSILHCTWVASAGSPTNGSSDAVLAVVRAWDPVHHPNSVMVILYNSFSDTEFVGQGFHLIVACP